VRWKIESVPAGNAELLLRAFAGAIPTLCHCPLARIMIPGASKLTLDSLDDWRLLLSTVDCVRPFASTFNIPNEVSEKLGKEFRRPSRPDLFHKEGLDYWLPGWLVLLFGME
jgi:hypothetical protein